MAVTPTFVGSIGGAGSPNYLDTARDVVVSGNYAYVAAHTERSLTIIDISDKENPAFVSSIRGNGSPNYLGNPSAIAVSGNYAYVAAGSDGLTIIDISTPASPTFVSNIQGSDSPNYLGSPDAVAVSGDYAYLTAWNSVAGETLTIIDISTPASPTFVGKLDMSNAWQVFVLGDYAYVLIWNADDTGTLSIVDISTPASPSVVGSISGRAAPNYLGGASKVVVSGDYAYVSASSIDDNSVGALTIIDVSTPASPAFVGSIQGAGSPNYLEGAWGVAVSGNYAYVVSDVDNALTIIDVSTPASPTFVGSIQGAGSPNYLDEAYAVAVSGGYVYVAANKDDALTIINVLAHPVPSGENAMITYRRLIAVGSDKVFYEDI